jgi:hypothetical protein
MTHAKDEALKLAKECGATTYTNRHYPDATAVTFSPLAWENFCKQALAAQPAVPDAIHHTDLSEHPQYIEGWNDCRAEMLKGMKP